jgi:hypothetical protein
VKNVVKLYVPPVPDAALRGGDFSTRPPTVK